MEQSKKRKKHAHKEILDNFSQLCRDVIRHQIAEFKASKLHPNGYYYSDWTGYKITNSRKAQVNHVIPFRELLFNFVNSRKLDLLTIFELPSAELKKILKDFANYHNKNAKLNILRESENKRDFYMNRSKFRKWQEFFE
ncbi:MAG: hypothetical protein FWK04_30075 [Nostoc sp. GBBB01]|nr:hypothetical protein [Nostoc sp. GBBB01]